jgi:hypothetical protein
MNNIRHELSLHGQKEISARDKLINLSLSIDEFESICKKFGGVRQEGVEWGDVLNDEGPGHYMFVKGRIGLFICFHPNTKCLYFT